MASPPSKRRREKESKGGGELASPPSKRRRKKESKGGGDLASRPSKRRLTKESKGGGDSLRNMSPLVVFAHGAGASSSSDWMIRWKEMLGNALNAVEVVTFDYPYISGGKRKAPPEAEKLVEYHSDIVRRAAAKHPGHPLILVGKSMGSRVSCMVAVKEDIRTSAIVCLGYPLKGGKDGLCPLDRLATVQKKMKSDNALHVIDGGDHSFKIGKKFLQSSGSSQAEAEEQAVKAIAEFISKSIESLRHMDSQLEALDTRLLGNIDATDARVVPASSFKKRGPAKGASLDVQPDRKKVLKTNEFGQPNEDCPNHRHFASHIGVLTRTHIPIIYQDFRQVPREHIQTVTDTLSQFYEFESQSWDASLIYITHRINETWRNYKKRLTAKYIKDNDPAVVRDGPVPPGISMEDWRVFVDQHSTEQFKCASARNKGNRAKLKGPACLGRRSMAVTRHKMAMERNLTSDAEVGRGDVYLRAHTSKDKVVQFPDLAEKLNELYSSNPASRMTDVDDALTQLLGPDSRGRMRGLGCSVGKTGLKKSAPARSKAETMTKEKESLAHEILEIKKSLDDIKAWIGMQQKARFGQNLSTFPTARSSEASSSDMIYVGKRCDLLGWGKRGVVARGKVHEVASNAIVHTQPLDEGAFGVVLTEIIQPDAPLWNEDGLACTIGEAGLGSFVQWGKDSLRIQ
ncbi:uncharacterized protein LOC131241252 isoform X2 [Magnolia sinica]|uniref:uncharacterized protein LOC131241252 isoform X2 n=1 Tax=Magnolia sinica TaxID=86752 RepID=UPI00265B536D|nr:uncharacterized protein LOC131241252 isoform X2 [Magnolia sinica]